MDTSEITVTIPPAASRHIRNGINHVLEFGSPAGAPLDVLDDEDVVSGLRMVLRTASDSGGMPSRPNDVVQVTTTMRGSLALWAIARVLLERPSLLGIDNGLPPDAREGIETFATAMRDDLDVYEPLLSNIEAQLGAA